MNEEDVLHELNELIEEEHGTAIQIHDRVIDSGVDSFGITMVFVAIDNKYEVYGKEEFRKIDFSRITAKEVIEKVLDKHDSK